MLCSIKSNLVVSTYVKSLLILSFCKFFLLLPFFFWSIFLLLAYKLERSLDNEVMNYKQWHNEWTKRTDYKLHDLSHK